MKIAISKIRPNPEQPRQDFDEESLASLAESITSVGLLNPIVIEGPYPDGFYNLIDGERRWRASQLAGFGEIEAHVLDKMNGNHKQRLEMALIGNLQREDLNPIEEANAISQLRKLGKRVNEIANLMNRSTSWVTFREEILTLDPEIQALFAAKKLPVDQSVWRSLDLIEDRQKRIEIARQIAKRKMITTTIKALCQRVAHGYSNRRSSRSMDSKQEPILVLAKIDDEQLKKAAVRVCQNCILREGATLAVCKECPMNMFFKELKDNCDAHQN